MTVCFTQNPSSGQPDVWNADRSEVAQNDIGQSGHDGVKLRLRLFAVCPTELPDEVLVGERSDALLHEVLIFFEAKCDGPEEEF